MTGFDGLNMQRLTYSGPGLALAGLTQVLYLPGQTSKHAIRPDENVICVLNQAFCSSTQVLVG